MRFIERNDHQAEVIAHHIRAVNKGAFPFVLTVDYKLDATRWADDPVVKDFALHLNEHLPALCKLLTPP